MQTYFDFITDDMAVSGIALAGGGARATVGSCGAFSAGLMALSASLCPGALELSDEEIEELEKVRPKFYDFRDWFIGEFGGVSCSEVLCKLFGRSYDLSSEKERKELHELQEKLGFNCEVVTGKTAVKLAKMLSDDK